MLFFLIYLRILLMSKSFPCKIPLYTGLSIFKLLKSPVFRSCYSFDGNYSEAEEVQGWLALSTNRYKKLRTKSNSGLQSNNPIMSCFIFEVNLTRDFRSLNRSQCYKCWCVSVCLSFPAFTRSFSASGQSWSSQNIVFPLLFSPCSSL